MNCESKINLRIFEVKKTLTGGKILEISKNKLIENADNFEAGDRMVFDLSKGAVVAVRKEIGWSINNNLCTEYTKNLITLIS